MSEKFLPLSVPNIKGNAEKYVLETIQTGWVSSVGSYVTKFEEDFAAYIGTKYAVAVSNGTAALHISLILSGVEAGDEVLVPNLTFVAPVNTVKYCAAHPVLMDSEWDSLGMDVNKVKQFLEQETIFKEGYTYNKKTNRRVKAIIPMHTLGYVVDMDPLLKICKEYNIAVIEDATESLGSTYKGIKTGNFAPLACFSFNGNKIMTTGGGGMIVTNDEELARRAKHLTTTAKTDPLEYDHDEVGYNYRMVNVLAALGVAQLELMEEFVATKRKNLAIYQELLTPVKGFSMHVEPSQVQSNYWMYSLLLEEGSKHTVKEVIQHLAQHNIQARPIWKLMSMLPMYKDCENYKCETSLEIYKRVVNVPCSTDLTTADITRVVEAIKQIAH